MTIEVRQVSKTFAAFPALREISLEVQDGSLVALLGPSGSGKTTLLRIMAGLERPDPDPDTVVLLHGRDVTRAGVAERGVGFVFQHYALFRHMNVFENIAFGLRVRPRSLRPHAAAIEARVRHLLSLVQLEGIERRLPGQLSGGQRQRVALARALAVEPRILLLDEPFGALDAKVRLDLRRWLRRLHDELHVTSVFVTHDQEEALEVADRIVVLNHGRIEQEGTPEEVFHRPATEFVMNFLGHVNLFHGRTEKGRAVFGPLAVSAPAATPGQSARLLVRPHDLEIHAGARDAGALQARILRIQSAGPTVKVELKAATGGVIHVEMPHERFRAGPLAVGQDVFVSPREARVFVEDYEI